MRSVHLPFAMYWSALNWLTRARALKTTSAFFAGPQPLLIAIFPAIWRHWIVTGSDTLLPASTACLGATAPTRPLSIITIHWNNLEKNLLEFKSETKMRQLQCIGVPCCCVVNRHFWVPNTDHVTIPKRFEPFSCSFKRQCANMEMSNFDSKHSPGNRHMICIKKTKFTSEKGLLFCRWKTSENRRNFLKTPGMNMQKAGKARFEYLLLSINTRNALLCLMLLSEKRN